MTNNQREALAQRLFETPIGYPLSPQQIDALADAALAWFASRPSARTMGEREALLAVLRTEVPAYVDTESAVWGAAHALILTRRPSAPTVTAEQQVARGSLMREVTLADASMRKWVTVPVKVVRAALGIEVQP